MKTGLSLQELAVELERQAEAKADYVADTRQLRFRPADDGVRLHGLPDGDMPLRNSAHGQFATRLGVPRAYYDRCAKDAPDLLADNLNHWLTAEPKRTLVRTLDGNVRAFLSDKYRPLDNIDFAHAVLPALRDTGGAVESCQITESKMYIKVVRHDLTADILPAGVSDRSELTMGQGHIMFDVVEAGLVFGNSEIGAGSLFLDPAIHTTHCTNLAVWSASGVRRTHLGKALGGDDGDEVRRWLTDETREKSDQALFGQITDLTRAAMDGRIFNEHVAKLKAARGGDTLQDPVKGIERVAKQLKFSEDESASVLKHLIEGGDLSRYGLANAVTRAAQDVESYDRSTELEYAGAAVIELPKSQWKHVAVDG